MREIKEEVKFTEMGKVFFNKEIPSDWDIKKFEDIAEIDKESLKSSTSKDYEFDYISLSDVDSGDFKIETTRQTFVTSPTRARRVVRKGDILMSTVRPNLQGFSIIKDEVKDLIASTGFAVITASKCNNEFLFQYLFSSWVSRQFYLLLVGSNYPAINSSDVRRLQIPLPPLPEQHAIAQVLGTIDQSILTTERLIAQKELRKKWLMQNLLTGKMRLKGFDGEWKFISISNLFIPVNRYVDWNESELYKLISIRRRNGGVFYRDPLFGYQIGVKKLKTVLKNDFLISKRQVSHGAWAIINSDFNKAKVSDEYVCLEIADKKIITADFCKWYCQFPILTHYANVDSDGVHIEKSIFDYDLFKKRKVLIPDTIEEQTAIAELLKTADKEIKLLKAMAEKLREQKKGLMQQLLTGKKRLV